MCNKDERIRDLEQTVEALKAEVEARRAERDKAITNTILETDKVIDLTHEVARLREALEQIAGWPELSGRSAMVMQGYAKAALAREGGEGREAGAGAETPDKGGES